MSDGQIEGEEAYFDDWVGADDSTVEEILGIDSDKRLRLLSQKPIIEQVMDEQYSKTLQNAVFQNEK